VTGMSGRAISLMARLSMRANKLRGGKMPHLTICAELWLLDKRLPIFIIDAMMSPNLSRT